MKEKGSGWADRNGSPRTEMTRSKRGADDLPNGGLEMHKRDSRDETGCCCRCPCFKKISSAIVSALESVFYK